MNTLNPVCKFIGILIPTLILAAIHDPILNFITFIVCMILLFASRVRIKFLLLLMMPIVIMAVGMFFTGYHFQAGSASPVNAENMNISDSNIWNGLTLSSRVLVYASLGILFVLTTNKMELLRSLQQQLRLPPVFSYGLLAAWNMFPNLIEEYKKTQIAFQARGLRSSPLSPALLKPMLVKAVLWSEALSIAMESKGFNGNASRTEYHELKLSWKDYAFPVTTSVVFGSIIFWVGV